MIISGIITAIINDIRNTYLAAKKHVLGLLRNLYDSIYYANSALDNFCDIYAESSFRYETSWDVDGVKASCLKLRKEMEEWLLTADEKCKKVLNILGALPSY